MARAHPIRIELSDDMSEIVESVLETGEFQSADEVVSAALNAFQVQRLLANFTPEELEALIQEGVDSGEPIEAEEAFLQIEQELERHIASKRR